MSNFGALLSEVPDIITAIEEGEVAVIPVNYHSKRCTIDGWNEKNFTMDELLSHNGNFGFRIGKFKNGNSLICIDIDGTKTDDDKDKESSKKLIADILVKELERWGMVIETASGGIHIYMRTRGEPTEDAHEFSQRFCYPNDLGYAGMPKLAGQPLENAIEIFTPATDKSRYLVAPGAEVHEDGIDGFYKVSEGSKIKKILELPTVEFPRIEHFMEEALLRADFTFNDNTQAEIEDKYNVGFVKKGDSPKSLSSFTIPKLGDFLIPIYKYNDGSKYYMTLAVSRYLSDFIDEESIILLGEYIIENTEKNFFKDDNHFLKILTSSYHNDKDKPQTGGRTLYDDYAKDVYPAKEFWFKIIAYTDSDVWFSPTGTRGKSYLKINLQNSENQVVVESWAKNKKGEEYLKSVRPVLGFQIRNIKRIRNPIIEDAPETYEMQYIPAGQQKVKKLVGSNMKDIEDGLKKEVGLILDSNYKMIFNQIIVHLSKINFIDTTVGSSVPGIFNIDGEIRRFDYNKNEVLPKYNKEDLIGAVELLNQIKDVFPTDTDKLGNICRIGLLLPFYHILKSNGHIAKFLILAQAGGTLKSTISEMIVNFYNPSKTTTKQANIFNGGQFSSAYQVGNKFGISSYPFIVNEPATALQDQDIIEILKSAIESDVARVTHDASYYSYSTAILSTNVDIQQSDAFLRRSNVFYFNASERATEEDIARIAELLNKNRINDRFQELSPIGDFCFTYLAENKHLFEEMTVEALELHLVDKLEEVTSADLSWMKNDAKEDTISAIEEIDDEVLEAFLQEIKDCYNNTFRVYTTIELDENENVSLPNAFNKEGLITIITRGICSILDYNPNSDAIIISGNKLKNFFKRRYNKIVTSSSFYEELLPYADDYEIGKGRFYHNKKQIRGIRVEPELIIDLLNNDLRDDENE